MCNRGGRWCGSNGTVRAVAAAGLRVATVQAAINDLGAVAGSLQGRSIIVSHTGRVIAGSNQQMMFGYVLTGGR